MQEDNYKKLENNFNKQYETKYSKILEEREQKRLKNLKSKAVCFYVSAIIVIVEIILTAMILILGQNGTIPQAITGIVIQLNILISLASVIFSLVFSYQTDCKKTNKELKTTLLPSILAQLNVRYKLAADFNKNLLERTLVTNKHKLSKFDNSVYGKYNNIYFEVVDCFLFDSTETAIASFGGIIVRLKFENDFQSHSVLRACDMALNIKKLSQISINPSFDEKFKVYTNNEQDAKKLITPELIERLNSISQSYSAKLKSCAFCKNEALFAFESYINHFELLSYTKEASDFKQAYFAIYDEIISVFKLIDFLKDGLK